MLFLESYIRWSHMPREHLRIIRQRPEFGMDRFLQIVKGTAGKISPSDGSPKQRVPAEQRILFRNVDAHTAR